MGFGGLTRYQPIFFPVLPSWSWEVRTKRTCGLVMFLFLLSISWFWSFRFLVRVSGVNQVGFVGTESRLEGEGVG